ALLVTRPSKLCSSAFRRNPPKFPRHPSCIDAPWLVFVALRHVEPPFTAPPKTEHGAERSETDCRRQPEGDARRGGSTPNKRLPIFPLLLSLSYRQSEGI